MAFIQNISGERILTGGWVKNYSNKEEADEQFFMEYLEIKEIDDGSLNSPVLRDLVKRGILRVVNVDPIPQISQDLDSRDPDVIQKNIEGIVDGSIPVNSAGGPAGGDLSGSYPNPSVSTVGGAPAASISSHISDNSNPHNTSISNISQGTLADLNLKITDATLDDISGSRTPSGPASGDLSGNYPNPSVASVGGVLSSDIASHLSDINNPHSTSISNLNPGTLADLNLAITDATLDDVSGSRNPSGPAGGDLSGTYPNPSVSLVGGTPAAAISSHLTNTANPHNTSLANISPGTLADLNLAITDATLDDVSGSRTPTGIAGGDLAGSYPNPTVSSVGGVTAGTLSSHISDINNPHATDIGNLGGGTLAELNSKITDADLISGISILDESVTVPGGPFTSIDFIGRPVVASSLSAGSTEVQIKYPSFVNIFRGTTNFNSLSTTYTAIPGMSVTGLSGNFGIISNISVRGSARGTLIELSYFLNNVQRTSTVFIVGGNRFHISTLFDKVTLAPTDILDLRARVSNANGSFTVKYRDLYYLEIN